MQSNPFLITRHIIFCSLSCQRGRGSSDHDENTAMTSRSPATGSIRRTCFGKRCPLLLILIGFVCYGVVSAVIFRVHIVLPAGSPPSSLSEQKLEGTRRHSCTVGNQTFTYPEVPSFLIVGAQKSGTTTLADKLREHPNIVSTRDFSENFHETHFFDWRFPNAETRQKMMLEQNISEDEVFCHCRQAYLQKFDTSVMLRKSQMLAFEKTPSYLFHDNIPGLVLRTCPWKPKVIVLLRNPIDRAFSHHNMDLRKKRVNNSFEEAVNHELHWMREFSLSNAPPLMNSSRWNISDFFIPDLSREDLSKKHKRLFRRVFISNYLQRGLYWRQLLEWKEVFGESHLLVINYERLYAIETSRQEYSRILAFLGVPKQRFRDESWSGANYRSKMADSTRSYLCEFFRPHNAMLEVILGKEWRGVWG